jgi:hypothetical protein
MFERGDDESVFGPPQAAECRYKVPNARFKLHRSGPNIRGGGVEKSVGSERGLVRLKISSEEAFEDDMSQGGRGGKMRLGRRSFLNGEPLFRVGLDGK